MSPFFPESMCVPVGEALVPAEEGIWDNYRVKKQLLHSWLALYTPYSARMSPENTHKVMGFYMEISILGFILQYMVSPSFEVFPIGCMGFRKW